MIGWLDTPREAADSYIISLHGRYDVTLPPAGGIDGDDMWMYESVDNMFMLFGVAQGCDLSSWSRTYTPFDGVAANWHLRCYEY
jgi:hypothetical protein